MLRQLCAVSLPAAVGGIKAEVASTVIDDKTQLGASVLLVGTGTVEERENR